jgi:hypothetical protein
MSEADSVTKETVTKNPSPPTPPVASAKATPRVVVLLATVPARKNSCERLLDEVAKQSRKPDGVVLVLDGYGDAPAPKCALPIITTHRTEKPTGAGARWRAVANFPPETIVVCLDDDIMLIEAPNLIRKLVDAVESGGGAAAAMGRSADGKFAPPGKFSRGDLIHGLGCGLAVRAKHLTGLQKFADEVRADNGPDALGLRGDDDALVSAFLWRNKVRILHAATGNIFAAPGTQASAARNGSKEAPNAQKLAIKKLTGWPWIDSTVIGRSNGQRA